MCGIFFSLSTEEHCYPGQLTEQLIRNRGSDSVQTRCVTVADDETVYLTFTSSVLALRGDSTQAQPLVDEESKSVLCWNGEVWKFADRPLEGNDTYAVFQSFLDAVKPCNGESTEDTLKKLCVAINNISGPFSFVFYDNYACRLFYGRDYLGRRSLLQGWNSDGHFRLSSVRDEHASDYFEEVDTTGIHVIDLADLAEQNAATRAEAPKCPVKITIIPWSPDPSSSSLKRPVPAMNTFIPESDSPPQLSIESPCISTLQEKLRESLELRLTTIPGILTSPDPKVAVLFSGGLDCTLLARLAHDILPDAAPIDLLNVAFENPRVVAAATKNMTAGASISVYDECPDRKTGISSYHELKRVCPSRKWRFIRINIPYTETIEHRSHVKHLMSPHNTEMDLSIACALYFAARGKGTYHPDADNDGNETPYTTPARALLSGLGADEVFAGYSRHSIAFSRQGFRGLIDEVQLDVGRLGKRNLGRDDRVISHWGKEARYPYLDEAFLTWTLCRPMWEKCGFGCVKAEGEVEVDVEDGKKALRLMAWKLGMRDVAREKKRAIQFGSRTAKMECGRVRGTHVLE
ncbi:asparagine synthetase domain containing 1 [Arthroderma uncinatum]|uniref:asparagine synthetase domain containing 1 n=1 Tax=Arthroderma uncinatum TaxID=74035 RepID=UPI00144ACBC5|nr:asparagine synthetase domain containing 1 [Arthroderma uncinatum]KAF3480233.1 asparagine synthetase domain containing 1 [Arthroderma uncinatum]